MKLLIALTYYRPHVSGLTIYAQRLAEGLAARGHAVTVLTSRHDRRLAAEETLGGVRVVRVPAAARVSKGVLMPAYPIAMLRLLHRCDAAILNLPCTPLEALLVPFAGRFLVPRPVVAVYHCDVLLPAGLLNWLITSGVLLTDLAAAALVRRLVAYTADYASRSRVLRRFPGKLEVIPPPILIGEPAPENVAALRRAHAPDGERLIGFVARFAAEKGVEVLLRAMPEIQAAVGPVRVLFAGEHESVIGERPYRKRLQPLLAAAGERWRFLGVLPPAELAHFYAACDVTVLPSLNRTESFGLVQVESMLCGTPVVASELPGVRVPITATGMGKLAPAGDVAALAGAVVEVIRNREKFRMPRALVAQAFSSETTFTGYERMLAELTAQGADDRSPRS